MSDPKQKPGNLMIIVIILGMCLMSMVMWMQRTAPVPSTPEEMQTAAGDDDPHAHHTMSVAHNPVTSMTPFTGTFSLTDHSNQPVTQDSYERPYKLMFFGFTHCAAICPTALQKMALILNELGPTADKIQPLFVTVDPDRDTPEALKSYVEMYHPALIGLTGSKAQLAAVYNNFKVYTHEVDDELSGEKIMDHSSYTYLMGPDNKLVKLFALETPAMDIVSNIQKELNKK